MTNDNWKAGLAGLALLAAMGLICPLLAAPRIPLVDPIEGLHASIAQEMVEHGDWIVPRQLREPFLDKPILYFWAIAASLKLFGMSEAAVRLPGLLFGLLGTLTTALVGYRLLGRRTGLLSGIFYAAMVLPLALVQQPAHDAALVPLVNLALLCLWESDGRVRSIGFSRSSEIPGRTSGTWIWTAAAGVFLGLAILTKGLAGVAMAGVAYGSYLVLSRRLRMIHCLRAALAMTTAAAVAGAWYIAVERENPGYLRYFFFERHVLGFFTGSQPHGGAPWWYYLPILAVGGIPWIWYLPALLRDEWERWRRGLPVGWDEQTAEHGGTAVAACPVGEVPSTRCAGAPPRDLVPPYVGRRPMLLLGCWFIGCTLLLSVSHSKLVTYLWPVFPAVAILAAVVWVRKIEGLLCGAAQRWMSAVVWCTCLVGPAALPVTLAATQIAMPTRFSPLVWAIAIAVALTTWTPLVAWFVGRTRLTIALASASVCGQLLVLLWFVLPQVAVGLSARDLARHYNRTGVLPSRMMLAQERVGSVLFYLDRNLRDRLQPGQIANQDVGDPLPMPRTGADECIAIPDRHLQWARNDYELDYAPFEKIDGFRLYRRIDLEPRSLRDHGESSRAMMGQGEGPALR